jgi:hypothetical protein
MNFPNETQVLHIKNVKLYRKEKAHPGASPRNYTYLQQGFFKGVFPFFFKETNTFLFAEYETRNNS